MAGKDKREQKKKAKRQERLKEKRSREELAVQRKVTLKDEEETLQSIRRNAKTLKNHLRQSGCDLPFYDFMDSYAVEYKRLIQWAKERYPALLGVHDVSPEDFSIHDFVPPEYCDLELVIFSMGEEVRDYVLGEKKGNIEGSTSVLLDKSGEPRILVQIPTDVGLNGTHVPDLHYQAKICALCHEIGHVHDFSSQLNIDLQDRTMNVVEAEVFANLYAFDLMAERQLVQCYQLLLDGIRNSAPMGGGTGMICNQVLEKMPIHNLVKWQEFLGEKEP